MNEQLIADLKETRRQLEVRGRCTGELMKPNGKVCLDGAVVAVINSDLNLGGFEGSRVGYTILSTDPRALQVIAALWEVLPEERKHASEMEFRYGDVWGYNDDELITDQDCFDLIDKALAQAGGLA